MAPMTSPDTATHSGHGKHGEGEENLEVGQLLPKSGLLCSVSVLWVAYLTIMLYGDNSNLFCQWGIWRYNKDIIVEANNTSFV